MEWQGSLKVEKGDRSERCNVSRTPLTFAAFEDGEREPPAKECGLTLEAEKKAREWILPRAYRKELSLANA